MANCNSEKVEVVRPPRSGVADQAPVEPSAVERASDGATSFAAHSDALPIFKFFLSNPGHRHFGCITAAGEVLHRIGDFDEFFAALGYTGKMRQDGVVPEEFIWDRYTRDGAPMSAQCIQACIAMFLHKHSPKFRDLYGHAYDRTIGKCVLDHTDGHTRDCADCSRHPPFGAAGAGA